MKIVIGCDHAGLNVKEKIRGHLAQKGIEIKDLGIYREDEKCDYPDKAAELSRIMQNDKSYDFGILVCGTGIGMSITANKFTGIRAAALSDKISAEYTRLHNDANVLCIGERIVSPEAATELTDIFIQTPFDGGERHSRRVAEISGYEKENSK